VYLLFFYKIAVTLSIIACQITDGAYQPVIVVADQLEHERAEQQQVELQRKQREEERLEEARHREQQALQELQRQQQVFLHVMSAYSLQPVTDWL